MKKDQSKIEILTGILMLFHTIGLSQINLKDINNKNYLADSIQILNERVVFLESSSKTNISLKKREISNIVFQGNDSIQYIYNYLNGKSSTYNTINFYNGSFISGIVEKVTQDSIYYRRMDEAMVKVVDSREISFINYGNGLIENFHFPSSKYYNQTSKGKEERGAVNSVDRYHKVVNTDSKPGRSSNKSFFGVTAGYAKSKVYSENSYYEYTKKNDYFDGYNLGISYFMNMGRKSGLAMEIIYIQKGSRFSQFSTYYSYGTSFDTLKNVTVKLNYIELPVYFVTRWPIGKLELGLDYGGYYNFFQRSSIKSVDVGYNFTSRRHDVGILFGLRLMKTYDKHAISGGVRFTQGLSVAGSDLTKNGYYIAEMGTIKCLSFNLTYFFNL